MTCDGYNQHAEYTLQAKAAEERRHGLIRHLRERHMRPPMQTWVSRCRWCGLIGWWELIREPASRMTQDDLLLRVRRLEERADQFDGDSCPECGEVGLHGCLGRQTEIEKFIEEWIDGQCRKSEPNSPTIDH